jgi:2-dehydro-3-deoxy-D-arabinonate dehydratase
MQLSKHATPSGHRWALEGMFLAPSLTLSQILEVRGERLTDFLAAAATEDRASGHVVAPVDPQQEVWASGVTYLRSRDARMAESESSKDIYDNVYVAERPELFPKAVGWRVAGPGEAVRVRADAQWSVPEPELVIVSNRFGEIVGYTAGNDASSRDIEGANPLYLPQAKIYDRSCALGPAIVVAGAEELTKVPIVLTIERDGKVVFSDETNTSEMKRSFNELCSYLHLELSWPNGVLLMTGTSLVPSDDFSLRERDRVSITVGAQRLINTVGR